MQLRSPEVLALVAVFGAAAVFAWPSGLRTPAPSVEQRSRDRGVATATARTAGPSARESAPIDDFPLLETRTPLDVQTVVGFCAAAGREQLPGLRRAALDSADPLVVGNALRALGRLGGVAGDGELTALLGDSRSRVRHATIVALGESGDPGVVSLLAPVLDGADATARRLVLQALGRLGDGAARDVLECYAPRASEADRAFLNAALSKGRKDSGLR